MLLKTIHPQFSAQNKGLKVGWSFNESREIITEFSIEIVLEICHTKLEFAQRWVRKWPTTNHYLIPEVVHVRCNNFTDVL